MATTQTTYSETTRSALPGQVANMTNYDADTRVCETAAGIGFGVAVSQGTAANGALIGGASAAVFAGISVRDVTLPPSNSDVYAEGDNMAVMTEGDIWVTTGGDVTVGGDVTFNSTTGVLSSAAASGTQFAISGARWMTAASSGSIAVLRMSGHLPSA